MTIHTSFNTIAAATTVSTPATTFQPQPQQPPPPPPPQHRQLNLVLLSQSGLTLPPIIAIQPGESMSIGREGVDVIVRPLQTVLDQCVDVQLSHEDGTFMYYYKM